MVDLARLSFLAAWMCPTISLLGGGLPVSRIVGAVAAAALSGVLLSALPLAGFRAARLLTAIVLPLSLLWIGYVSLNGTGPTPSDALGTLRNTYTAEALGALRLIANQRSIAVAALQVMLLAGSFACGSPRRLRHSWTIVAASLAAAMVNAWLLPLLMDVPSAFPRRSDLQNFPYGCMADIVAGLLDPGSGVRWQTQPGSGRQAAHDAPVSQPIDAIFVLGEAFRFDRPLDFNFGGAGWAALNQRVGAGLGQWLPKVCASADATVISVPMLLTGTSPEHSRDAATAPSGLARLASAGYETAWISNQEDKLFSDEKRDLVWQAKGYGYDDALIPIAAAFLSWNQRRNKALLIHLWDSHAPYDQHYPPMPEPAGIDAERREALQYQRANDQTLAVLAKLAALVDAIAIPAFVVYVSDHGENLLADHNGMHYHFGARTTAKAAYVPAVVLWNSAFLRTFDPNERLRPLLAAPSLAHADIYHLWMNLAGLPDELHTTADPKIMGKANLTDQPGPVACSALAP
jgi:glucan phosphoethanolaminetransferase (alkaline phosphatase superfamily)